MNIKRFFSFIIVLNLLFCSIFTQAAEKPFVYQEQLYHPSGTGNTQQIQPRFLGGIGGIIGGAVVTYTVYQGFQHLSSKWEYLPPIGLTNDDITKIEAAYGKLIRLTSAERTELGIVNWTQLSDDFGTCLMMSSGGDHGACRRVAIYSDVDPAKAENEYERGAHNVRRGLHVTTAGVYFFSDQILDPYNFIPGGMVVKLSDKLGGAIIGIVKKDKNGTSRFIDRRNTETDFGKNKKNPCDTNASPRTGLPPNITCVELNANGGLLFGTKTKIPPKSDASTIRSLTRENEAAETLAGAGYHVEQNPVLPGLKEPDYKINGEIFDCYSPDTPSVRNIYSGVEKKVVVDKQTESVVINMADTSVTVEAVKQQFKDWPMPGLKKVIVIDQFGKITRIQ
jgi:hypothetical protein